jgi:hypothetical protein
MWLRMRFIAFLAPALCASGCLDEAGTGPSGEDVGFRNKVWTTPAGDFAPIAVGYHWTYHEIDSSGKANYATHVDSMAKSADRQIEYEIMSAQADAASGDSLYLVRERTRELSVDGTLGNPVDRMDSIRVKRDRPAGSSSQVILSPAFAIPFLFQDRYLDSAQTIPNGDWQQLKTALLGNDTLRAYHTATGGTVSIGGGAWRKECAYAENIGLFEETGWAGDVDLLWSYRFQLLEFNGRRFDHSQLRE